MDVVGFEGKLQCVTAPAQHNESMHEMHPSKTEHVQIA